MIETAGLEGYSRVFTGLTERHIPSQDSAEDYVPPALFRALGTARPSAARSSAAGCNLSPAACFSQDYAAFFGMLMRAGEPLFLNADKVPAHMEPFNPVSRTIYRGDLWFWLMNHVWREGQVEPRFVTPSQAAAQGWRVSPTAVPIPVPMTRHGEPALGLLLSGHDIDSLPPLVLDFRTPPRPAPMPDPMKRRVVAQALASLASAAPRPVRGSLADILTPDDFTSPVAGARYLNNLRQGEAHV